MSDSLVDLSMKLAQIILPMIMFLGIIGNTLNIIVLSRANLRNHACSKYFLALSSNNLIYSIFLIYFLLANGFNLDGQMVSNVLCKILQYIASLCPFLSPYFIVLASIDRYCASSSNVKFRQFSHVNVARKAIFIVVFCSSVFFINTLVLNEFRDDGYGCNIRPETLYHQIFFLVQILFYAAIPPILMITFGLLTISNTTRLGMIRQATNRHRRTERQLAQMLCLQVTVYILLNMPLCILYLMLILLLGYRPTRAFFFAFQITPFFFHFSYATTFFLYILSARVYREELIRLISKISPLKNRIEIQPISMTCPPIPTTRH